MLSFVILCMYVIILRNDKYCLYPLNHLVRLTGLFNTLLVQYSLVVLLFLLFVIGYFHTML